MKNFSRIALFVSILVLASVANTHAWPWDINSEYGTCNITCHDGEEFVLQAQYESTVQACCNQNYICPSNAPAAWITWDPYEGWPHFCGPYAD